MHTPKDWGESFGYVTYGHVAEANFDCRRAAKETPLERWSVTSIPLTTTHLLGHSLCYLLLYLPYSPLYPPG